MKDMILRVTNISVLLKNIFYKNKKNALCKKLFKNINNILNCVNHYVSTRQVIVIIEYNIK